MPKGLEGSVIKVVKLLPGQMRVKDSKAREILYSGGYGSGKTSIGCWMAVREASRKGNRVLILRKTFTSLRKSTLNTLLEILPGSTYSHNKSDAVITLNGGGEIYYMGCDDPERIKSCEFGAAFIDEASELTEEEYQVIKYRVRLLAGSRRIYLCTNPSSQNHWIYRRFFEQKNDSREAITASSLENRWLPEDYKEELKTMEGSRYRRCVEGQWINLDSAIFDNFNRDIHVVNLPIKQYEDIIIGIDYGYTHPTGMVVAGKCGEKLEIIDEFYKNKLLLRDIVKQIQAYAVKYDNPSFVYDPSAASLGAELENLRLNATKANNDVHQSIDRIRDRLNSNEILISASCTNLIREMENYQYQPGTEKPVKVGDDLIDPVRYLVNFVEDQKNNYIHPIFTDVDNEGSEESDKFDGWQEMDIFSNNM